MTDGKPKLTIVIAGASGFVGRALIRALRGEHRVIALTRGPSRVDEDGVEWRSCDLFSLLDAERAVAGADVAFYFVHSMLPSARLTQGGFEDMDLICADNFARAAEREKLRRIIYLGGLLPETPELSRHLQSRLEVEQTLGSRQVPLTTLRAGLIVGAGGSSFQMMRGLVERLPAMICPRWASSRCQPIALDDVVVLLRHALETPATAGETHDIAGPDVLTYAEMLQVTGDVIGRHPPIITVPFFSPGLSLLWVSLVTGAPRELVRPLVESLRHDMVARDGLRMQKAAGVVGQPFRDAVEGALREEKAEQAREAGRVRSVASRPEAEREKTVRSVQRLPLPAGRDAMWVAAEYGRWLPGWFRSFIVVDTDAERNVRFSLVWPRIMLLELAFAVGRSDPDLQLFYITGGALAAPTSGRRGRLEFRSVLGGRHVLAAIHDFSPTLPWFIYNLSQALVHLLVMRGFAAHLGAAPALPARALPPPPAEPAACSTRGETGAILVRVRRFQNIDPSPNFRGFKDVLRWQLNLGPEPRRRSPGQAPVPFVENDGKALVGAPVPALTWVGHATYLLQMAGVSILTDPVFSSRLAVIPRNAPPGVAFGALPRIDVVTVSHNHRDHMDAPTLARLGPSPTYVVPLGLADWFRSHGLPKVVELDWWQSAEVAGVRFTLVPAQHWSRRGLNDVDATLWGGFVYEGSGLRAYHSGDTAYFTGFRAIGERMGAIDAAMLPIGAYEPRWFMKPQHMNPEDALQAFLDLGARRFFAMHWGTFKLTDEPINEPPQFLRRLWAERGLDAARLCIPAIGETVAL